MTELKIKKNYNEAIVREFNTHTFDRISAHVRLDFSKDNIPDNFLIIATIFDNENQFEGIVIEKNSLNKFKKKGGLLLKLSKTDANLICENAHTWQFKEGIVPLMIATM